MITTPNFYAVSKGIKCADSAVFKLTKILTLSKGYIKVQNFHGLSFQLTKLHLSISMEAS